MKKLFTVAAFAAFSLMRANAQTVDAVRVHFDHLVQAGTSTLPAGDYTITMLRSSGDVPLLRISADRGASVLVFASRQARPTNEPARRTEVLLEKNGSTEHMSRIEIVGSDFDLVLAGATP